MTIQVTLDRMLERRGMTLTELSERIGITLANLSILKTNKARAVRFSTLEALCREHRSPYRRGLRLSHHCRAPR